MSQPRFWIAAVIVAAAIAPSPVRAGSKNEIRAVTFEDDAGTTRVRVRGAQTPTFTVYKLERPSRVVIDVPQARLAEPLRGHEGAAVLAANTWAVSTIAAQELDDGGLVVRVIVTLARPGRYDVKAFGNELVVMVMARDPVPRVASAEALAAAQAEREQARRAAQAAEQGRAQAERSSAAARTEAAKTKAEAERALREARVEAERVQARVAAVQADAAKARQDAAREIEEAARTKTQAEAAKQEVARTKAEAETAKAEAETAKAEAARIKAQVIAAKNHAARARAEATVAPAVAGPGKAGVPVQLASSTATQPVGRPHARASATQAPAAPAPAAQPVGKLANGTPPGQVHDIGFTGDDVTGHITIALTGDATVTIGNVTQAAAELIIDHAQLAPKLERKLDTSRFGGPVRAVSSFRDRKTPDRVRVIAELASPATPSFDREAGGIRWNFVGADIAKRPVTVRPGLVRTQHVPAPVVGGFGAASTPIAQQSVAQLPPQGNRRRVYHGQTVELHFKDAPIHDLLRLIADTGKVNIVVPDTVDAKVTLDLKRVPWDQALEVILSSHQLWYRREGNLYRIAPRKELDKEDEDEAARREAQLKAESPRSQLVPLNYSSATELAKKLEPMLSPHGKIAVDERTNQLIVTDVSGNREQISRLAQSLDTQTPQISIEARIVEARSTFLRQIGVQWGGRALAGAAGGNATGLVWPSSITLAGGNEDAQTNRGGIIAAPSDFAVNLPAATGSGEGGALGLSLGSVAGNFNINLRLSALEDAGTVRIISAPKITVANNKQASIASGVSIPISTISANGTQTQFVQADLRLDVTPTVSQRDCTISMNLVVQKNEPDFVNVGARGDPTILRKEAHTYMLVADGETSVLGGIYTRNSGLAYKKIPLLGDLPVLGWLFKNRRENDDRTEVLVFITPKITNRALLSCK